MNYIFKHKLMTLALGATSALALTSCSESFLDREPDGNYITADQMEKNMKWNTNILLGQVNGVNSNLVAWQSGGTTQQDDFGQKSVDIVDDLVSGDMVFPKGCSYGWFRAEARLQAYTQSANRSYIIWRYYYRVINSANSIIDMTNDELPENGENALYYAVAKTLRAHSYFNLVTHYAPPYDESKDRKVLPLYLTATESNYLAPSTVDQVYTQIINDLTSAIEAYEYAEENGCAPTDISMPDLSVAHTILAYAYLQKGDNTNALAQAETAIEKSGKQILTYDNLTWGFNSINNNNWMWGIDITNETTGGLCTFWGMIDYFTYSYSAAGDYKSINIDLYNQAGEYYADPDGGELTATTADEEATESEDEEEEEPTPIYWDGRKNQFPAGYLYMPVNKFYDPARTPMGDATWTNDIQFMRIEEPYMIAAEAATRLGNLEKGRSFLKSILDERDVKKAEKLATMEQSDLLDEIYFNWRMEFWGEGRSLLTLKRFKKDMTRPANDYYNNVTSAGAIPYNDKRLYFSIPDKELENNPLMKDANPFN